MDRNRNAELINDTNISRFPFKLWKLINRSNKHVISWGNEGRTILLNYIRLEKYLKSEISIFKTKNIASFVRQLNLYGFQKVPTQLRDAICNSKNPHMHEFRHEHFQARRFDLIHKINRKDGGVRKQKFYKTTSPHLHACRLALRGALHRARMENIRKIPVSENVNSNIIHRNITGESESSLPVPNYEEYFVQRNMETPFHEVPVTVSLEEQEAIQSSDITSCSDPHNTRDQEEKTFYSSLYNNKKTKNSKFYWEITTEKLTHTNPGLWFNLSPSPIESVSVDRTQTELSELISNTIEILNE